MKNKFPSKFLWLVFIPVFLTNNLNGQSLIGLDSLSQYSIASIIDTMLAKRDSLGIRWHVSFPADSDTFAVSQIRFGAWVKDTTASVTIDENNYAVYPTGAVTGRFSLNPGWNTYPIHISGKAVEMDTTFHLYRLERDAPLSESSAKILQNSIHPQTHLRYYEAEDLTVSFRGSPGGQAFFRIWGVTDGKLPMVETPFSGSGYYEGVYQIGPNDQCENRKVIVYLHDKSIIRRKAKSQGRITIQQNGVPRIVTTAREKNLVYLVPGGEILTEIPADIHLQGIADLGAWWKIRLSESRSAYIRETDLDLTPPGTAWPTAMLHRISSDMDSNWVYIRFNITDKVPFSFHQTTHPQQIRLHLYHTRFQNEWTVYPEEDSLLQAIDWEAIDNDILEFTFTLNTAQQWGFHGFYDEMGRFTVAIRRPPNITREHLFENLIIALDAGHGGLHNGALGFTGITERDVNLVYTHYLADLLLNAGASVYLTRTADTTLILSERIDMAMEQNTHLFIWLHNNSTALMRDPHTVRGTSTYYKHLQAKPFSDAVYPYLKALNLEPEGLVHRSYYMTRQTAMVVYLIEGAFLSNPEDEMWLMNDDNLKRLAQAVFNGLRDRLMELSEQ